MPNLKIGARLSLAFAVLLLLMLVVGIGAIDRLAAVNGATTDLATNWLPATRDLGAFQAAIQSERRAEALMSTSSSPDVVARETQSLTHARASADEAWKRYETTVDTDEERRLAATVMEAASAYRGSASRTVELARKNDGAGAWVHYDGPGRAAFSALGEAVAADIAFQTRDADAAYTLSQSRFRNTRMVIAILLVAAVVIGVALAWAITRSITAPIRDAVRMAETVAAGDLRLRMRSARRDETGQLLEALQHMNDSLAGIVARVRGASDSIATGSAQIASGSEDLSQRTEQQASNLQETAASMEQLTATVKQNADAARQARTLSAAASETAARGGEIVTRVVSTMQQITTSSSKIADIIGVIDGIAFQTNILALNAAVEAARAGEQGRGFAVVAGEVRSLAQRSAESAKEIKRLIGQSMETVHAGNALVDSAGAAMGDIVAQVRRVNDLVEEISAASAEQSTGIDQIGAAVAQLDQVTQQNAALVEESTAAAESLKQQAGDMAQAVATFKLTAPAVA